jgi:hypothetical protein
LPAGEGVGESQFGRLEKSLALCLLCGHKVQSVGGLNRKLAATVHKFTNNYKLLQSLCYKLLVGSIESSHNPHSLSYTLLADSIEKYHNHSLSYTQLVGSMENYLLPQLFIELQTIGELNRKVPTLSTVSHTIGELLKKTTITLELVTHHWRAQ